MDVAVSSRPTLPMDGVKGINTGMGSSSYSEENNAGDALDKGDDIPFRTFHLPNDGIRLFTFAIDLARFLGYKKSFPMFEKNVKLTKRFLDDDEKDHLISVGLMANSLRNQKVLAVCANEIRKHVFIDEVNRLALIAKQQRREEMEGSDDETKTAQESTSRRRVASTAAAAASAAPVDPFSAMLSMRTASMSTPHSNSTMTLPTVPVANAMNNLTTYTTMAMAAAATSSISIFAPPVAFILPRTDAWMFQAATSTGDFNARLAEYRKHAPSFYESNTRMRLIKQPLNTITQTLIENHYNPSFPSQYPMALLPGQRQDALKSKPLKDSSGLLDLETSATPLPPIDDDQDNESLHKKSRSDFITEEEELSAKMANPLLEARLFFDVGFVSLGIPMTEATSSGPSGSSLLMSSSSSQLQQTYQHATKVIQCGALTSSNFPCEKLVVREGDRCAIHKAPKKDAPPKPKATGFVCGFRNMTGPSCHRPVPSQGEHCESHKGLKFFLCGFITLTGKPCVRVVYENGQRCALHRRETAAAVVAPEQTGCGICHKMNKKQLRLKEMEETLTCTGACQSLFHPSCLGMSKRMRDRIQSETWQCPDCRICRLCDETGQEESLLFCDDCDRGYHMDCLPMKLEKLPEGRWICSECNICDCCTINDAELLSIYADENNSEGEPIFLTQLCSGCSEHFDEGHFCPCCLKVYDGEEEERHHKRSSRRGSSAVTNLSDTMINCQQCSRRVHKVGCIATNENIDADDEDDVEVVHVKEEEHSNGRSLRKRSFSKMTGSGRKETASAVCLVCRAQEKQMAFDDRRHSVDAEVNESNTNLSVKRGPGRPKKVAFVKEEEDEELTEFDRKLLSLPMAHFRGAQVAIL